MRTLFALLAAAACAAAPASERIGGARPSYLDAVTEDVANRAAIGRRIWTPSLVEGYVPQGLTFADGYLYASSYLPQPDLKSNTGPCRVFRIETATGTAAGHFDLPVGACTHSGGLAHVGGGKLMLADTHRIFLIDVDRALASGKAGGAMKSLRLEGDLRGSYATFDGKDAWIGTWTRDAAGKPRMYRLDLKLFDAANDSAIDHTRALESIPVPLEAQGAALDAAGNIWMSASSGSFGRLYRLDRQGTVQARYDMTPGLEDLAFDGRTLGGMSESGTRKYLHWATKFPFIFEIDVAKLK